MSKFDRAYQVFTENGDIKNDRKQTIKSIAFVLKVSEANAGVYFYKCIKKFESQSVMEDQSASMNAAKAKEEPVSDNVKIKSSAPKKRTAIAKTTMMHNCTAEEINSFDVSMVPAFLVKSWERIGM